MKAKIKAIPESLFYTGGTITSGDIIKTSGKIKYDIAFNSNYMFIFNKGSFKPLKVVKIEYQTEYTFKIMKTKVKISEGFKNMVNDKFWECTVRDALNNIINITQGI